MGQGAIDYIGVKGGLDINGIIEDYYVYAGEKVSAGDFVEFINGVAGKTTATSSLTKTSGVAYYDISACKLSKNKVFIASNNSNKYLYGTVCTIEGAIITPGTTTQLNSEKYAGSALSVVALDENRVFVAHSINSSYMYLQGTVCAIDGTTIQIQATKQLLSGEGVGEKISAQLLPSGKIFIASGGSASDLYGTIVSVEGTTITRDSTTSLVADSTAWAITRIATALLGDTTVCIIHNYGTADLLYGIVCTISGTTVTAGADTSICSSNYSCMFLPSIATLSNDRVFVTHDYKSSSTYYLYGTVCTISGTTLSRGANTNLNSYTAQSSTVALSNEKVFIAYARGNDTFPLYGMICTVSGYAITAGTEKVLNTTEDSGYCISALLLEDNVFVAHSYDERRYLYARLYGVDEENLLPTTTVSIKEYETQVRPAILLPCKGVAKDNGEGGDSTGHKDIVSIYVPEPTYTYVDFTSNPAPTTWVGSSDGLSATATNTYGDWSVSATTVDSTSYPVQYVFDSSSSTVYKSATMSQNSRASVRIFLPNGIAIKPSQMSITSINCTSSSAILGTKADGTEVRLGTFGNGSTKQTITITVSDDEYYSAFRVTGILSLTSGTISVYSFEITSGTLRIQD